MTRPIHLAVSCRLSCHRLRSSSLIRRRVRRTRFRDGLRPTLNFPFPVAKVRHAEEVERLRLALPPLAAVLSRKPTELDEPGLVRMQFQSIVGQPLPEVPEEALRIALMLEAADKIVRIAHDDGVAFRYPLAPCVVKPVIEHVVQVNVGKAGGYYRPLRRSSAGVRPVGPLHDAGVEPFDDQPDNPLVPDAFPEHPDQMVAVEIIEEPPNIGVNDPVDPSLVYSDRDGVERIVRPAPRPETVAEPEELRLVDRYQNHIRHCALENLVLQRRNA